MRELTFEDARAASMGGLVFGAGGGGLERGLDAARTVFQVGTPVLVGLDELEGDDQVMVMTGVGAPGTRQQLVWPRDGLRALELACEAWDGHGALVGTMTAHPGAFMAGTWLANALDPHLAVIDCNANGRGHPTVAMGGMGLAGRTDINVVQAAVGGVEDHRGHIEIVARGPSASSRTSCTTPRLRPAACCSLRAGRSPSTSCASTEPWAPCLPASASARRCSPPRARAARR